VQRTGFASLRSAAPAADALVSRWKRKGYGVEELEEMCITKRKSPPKAMELREFLSSTLAQLIEGVVQAQEFAKNRGVEIFPKEGFPSDFEKMSRTMKTKRLVNIIEFDVAVVVVENKSLSGGIGIMVPEWNLGYHAKIDTEKSTVNRIKFSIPIVLPVQEK